MGGCGGSRDVVVEMPRKSPRRASLQPISARKNSDPEGLFSRPGSGPIVLTPDSKGRKNRIGIENNTSTSPALIGSQGDVRPSSRQSRKSIHDTAAETDSARATPTKRGSMTTVTVLPRIGSAGKFSFNDELRKGSAHSKSSHDSGISIEQSRPPPTVLPPVPTATSPTQLPPVNGKGVSPRQPAPVASSSGSSSSSGSASVVPRLASDEILSQLNEIGIVPLKTNRCGSSLAFNIEIEQNGAGGQRKLSGGPRSNSSESLEGSPGDSSSQPGGGGGGCRAGVLPPLPPNRIQRLQQLPPIQTSLDQLEAKQRKAEQRRKNREEKIRNKSEKLRQRRVSEMELSEREDDLKEKVSLEIQQKQEQNELNKQKLKDIQEEKRRKNEERLHRVKMNREKLLANGGGGYGDQVLTEDGISGSIEVGALNDDEQQSDLDNSGQKVATRNPSEQIGAHGDTGDFLIDTKNVKNDISAPEVNATSGNHNEPNDVF